jgi:TM2 domain-containing membrane protein YozV
METELNNGLTMFVLILWINWVLLLVQHRIGIGVLYEGFRVVGGV